MKFKKLFWLVFLFSIVMVSCSKQDDDFGEHGNVMIEFGTVCGWCAGEEKITVSSVKADYYRNIPCGDDKGTINETVAISSDEWNEITTSFDYDYFLTLDYNECNVCADGCDEFIIITTNDFSHEIRYAPSTEIWGLDELRAQLTNKLNEIRSAN